MTKYITSQITVLAIALLLFTVSYAVGANGEADLRSTIYQTGDGDLFDVEGNQYFLEGIYQFPNEKGEMIDKNCSEAIYLNDPNIVPDMYTYPPGSLPGEECILIKKDEVATPNLSPFDFSSALACQQFAIYAPPLVWGSPQWIASHIGSTTYDLRVSWNAGIPTSHAVQYWGTNGAWNVDYFGVTKRIYTGNAAASVYVNFMSHSTGVAGSLILC